MIKLIASDLDGTLLGSDKAISSRTAAALSAASEAGAIVVAATGRGRLSALPMLRPHAAITWAVCSNGATLWDLKADELVSNELIDRSKALSIVGEVQERHPEIGLAWETEIGFFWDAAYMQHRVARLGESAKQLGKLSERGGERPDPTSLEHGDVLKVLITHPDMGYDSWMDAVAPLLPTDVVASNSGTDFVEITADGVHKGAALASLCGDLGIGSEEVVAFGDQDNDRSMLAWAGRGVAMASGHPAVIAAADAVTASNDEDGVALVIESLLAEGLI